MDDEWSPWISDRLGDQMAAVYARWCARSVLHLWESTPEVRAWVETGAQELLAPAERSVFDRAYGYRCNYGREWDIAHQQRLHAMQTIGSTAGDADWSARELEQAVLPRKGAELARRRRQRVEELLMILPRLLSTRGLEAQGTAEAQEDPWLTLQVVRALALPDLVVWVDWCKQMEVTP